MNLENALSDDAFFRVSKVIAKKTSIHAALLLADLMSKRKYFRKRGMLNDDDSFFNTVENIENDTTLSKHQQQKALKELENVGFVVVKIKGLPRKRYYFIDDYVIAKFLINAHDNDNSQQSAKNSPISEQEINPLEGEKLFDNKNKVNQNVNNQNKEKESVGKDFLSLSQAHAIVADGGCIHRHQLTRDDYLSLFRYYGAQEDGSITREH